MRLRAVSLCLAAAVGLFSGVAAFIPGFCSARAVTPEAMPVLRLVYMANSGGAALPCPS